MPDPYASDFGTGWRSLSAEGAFERAFALGVAAAIGHDHPEEYKRIRDAVDTAYDRSIVELSYQEGKTRAREYRDPGDDGDDVWEEVVREEARGELTEVESPDELPSALTRLGLLDRPDDDLDALRLPDFLTR